MKTDGHTQTRPHVPQKEIENVILAQQAVPQVPSNEEQAEDWQGRHDPR
jgi:hypothetical protein